MEKFDKTYIKTNRLIIRNFEKNDYYDLYEYLSDIDTYKYEPGEPITIEIAKKLCIERSKENKFLTIELNNKVIGHVYLSQIKPFEFLTWEIGFIFNKIYQRKGYASESLNAIINHSFSNCNVHRIIGQCNPKNVASWKLMERVGMKREGKLRRNIYFKKDGKGDPIWLNTYVYGMFEEEII